MSDQAVELVGTTEPPVRVNAKQKASGEWYFEATARGDTAEEAVALLNEAVKEAVARPSSGRVGRS